MSCRSPSSARPGQGAGQARLAASTVAAGAGVAALPLPPLLKAPDERGPAPPPQPPELLLLAPVPALPAPNPPPLLPAAALLAPDVLQAPAPLLAAPLALAAPATLEAAAAELSSQRRGSVELTLNGLSNDAVGSSIGVSSAHNGVAAQVSTTGSLKDTIGSVGACDGKGSMASPAISAAAPRSGGALLSGQWRASGAGRAPGVWTKDLGVLGCVASPGVGLEDNVEANTKRAASLLLYSSKNESQDDDRLNAVLRGIAISRQSLDNRADRFPMTSSGNSCFSTPLISSERSMAFASASKLAKRSTAESRLFLT